MTTTDWLDWHAAYDDPASPQAQRLAVVRQVVGDAIASPERQALRVLGICAGDGRDLLPVLAERCGQAHVRGRLIELDPGLAGRARALAASLGLDGIEVVCADAGRAPSYAGAIPAGLVLVCGVLGNIADRDVERLIRSLPAMCAPGADVVWTRHRRAPDLTPAIRAWLGETGFEEHAFVSPGPDRFSVGRHRLTGAPGTSLLPDPLFTFVR